MAFPNGVHDDIVDALTQYLDYMATNPLLPPSPAPRIAAVVSSRGVANSILPAPSVSNIAVVASRSAAHPMPNPALWGMPTPIEPSHTHLAVVATPAGTRWKLV
jgi:hypothetical protein